VMLYEVNGWEQLFWNRLKALLDQIGNDRVELKERLTREWRANCWKRLNSQMLASQKRLKLANHEDNYIDYVVKGWASSISRFFDSEGVETLKADIQYRRGKGSNFRLTGLNKIMVYMRSVHE
jgi:hypothetical protein